MRTGIQNSIIVFLTVSLLFLTACEGTERLSWPLGSDPKDQSVQTLQNPQNHSQQDPQSDSNQQDTDPGQAQMSDKTSASQSLYDSFVQDIEAGQFSFSFSDVELQEVLDTYSQVWEDHPEYFWLSNSYTYVTSTSETHSQITLEPNCLNPSDVPNMNAQFQQIVDQITTTAASQPTVFDQILYIHDYIVEHTQYDNDSANILAQSDYLMEDVMRATTAYGCLVEGKAVCSGYAAAFQYLAQLLGFQCGRVSGTGNGENHEWNYLVLDGEYYFMDVTWDDPVAPDGTSADKSYEFFCITTPELLQTHQIGAGQDVPDCEGEKYNYFIATNQYLQTYTLEDVQAILNAHPTQETIQIKFSSTEECNAAKEDLIDNGKIYEISEKISPQRGLEYSQGTSGKILRIIPR